MTTTLQYFIKENSFEFRPFPELWEQDVSDLFQIDPSTQGIKNVNLKCGSNSMYVQLETESEFTGVMYTKGSFYDQAEPCFVKPDSRKGARSLTMRFAFDKCQTKQVRYFFVTLIWGRFVILILIF